MALDRPSRAELVQRVQAAITSRLGTEQLRRSNAIAYGRSFAGVADAIYSLVEFMHRQQFVTTAESEYLDRHGGIYGVTRIAATFATGKITFDVSSGGSVPANTIVQTADGVQIKTTSATNSAGVADAKAVSAGAVGNIPAGTQLTLTSPISGVGSVATSGVFAGGVDIEDDEALRTRILLKIQETPMGGSEADYKEWTLEVPTVTRVWVNPREDGDGTVAVRFVCDNNGIIPDSGTVAKVQAHLNDVRPVTAVVRVKAPTAYPVNFVFSSLQQDTAETRAAIQSELKSLFLREAAPGMTMLISHIRAAISHATGETDHVLTSPAGNVSPGVGQLPTLGSITWP